MSRRLEGKVAFITGIARGQGRSHAVRFAEEGAAIIGVDLCAPIGSVGYPLATPADLAATVAEVEAVGGKIVARQADVRDRDALASALDAGLAEFGGVDIVLANAGILPITGPGAGTVAAFTDAVEVNLTGVFHSVDLAIPTLLAQGRGGSIVITSSTSGLTGLADGSAGSMGYAAAKHGVVGLMRGWATVLAPDNIRVNTVHPTGLASPMVENESFAGYLDVHPQMRPRLRNALPVDLIEPIDISNALLWLCSAQARYVTGITLPVDAGFCLR